MRRVGRALAVIVLVVAGLATLLFVAVAIDNDGDSDLVYGGVALAALSLAVGAVAWLVQRRLRVRQPPEPAEQALERAERGETVELQPSVRKWALILAGSLFFCVVFVPLAFLAPQAVTITGAALFSLGVMVSAWALVPGGMFLRISPEGLLVKLPLRTRRYAWNDVENFRVFEVQSRYSTSRFVGFDLRALTPQRQSAWQTINRGMSGVDAALPDTYGLDPDRLAEALGRLRERYATEHGPSPSELADRELAARAALIDRSRRVAVTWLIALACAVLYVLQVTGDPSQVADLGASRQSDWWTLLTANLVHADLFHILFNLVAWGVAGALLEREIGAPRTAVLCLVAGVASTSGALLLQPDGVTVGLSGVVFAALGWGLLRDLHRTRSLGTVAWAFLPVGVIVTFLSPGTSIGGHLGGLAAGFLVGWALDRSRAG